MANIGKDKERVKPLVGLRSISEARSDIYKVDPRKIHVKAGWNGRDFSDQRTKLILNSWLFRSPRLVSKSR
jgi:hypothetical protein